MPKEEEAQLTREERIKRLRSDLEWAQGEYAKAILEKEGFPYDSKDPDINGAQEICPDTDDPIGDIQNVLSNLSGNSSYSNWEAPKAKTETENKNK